MENSFFKEYDKSKSLLIPFKEKVAKGEITLVNGHGHVFSSVHVPDNFLIERWPAIQEFLRDEDNVEEAITFLRSLSEREDDFFDRAADYLECGIIGQAAALRTWINGYEGLPGIDAGKMAFVVLMMDFKQSFSSQPAVSYEEQMMELLRIANRPEYKGRVLPFAFFDPRRENLDATLLTAFNNGAVGLKVYPSLGYLPTHDTALPYWEFFAENNIPVYTHCGKKGLVATHDKLILIRGRYNLRTMQKLHDKTVEFSGPFSSTPHRYFNNPCNWTPVLKRLRQNGLQFRLCIAHGGSLGHEINNLFKPWFNRTKRLVREYEGVYMDLSYISIKSCVRRYIIDQILDRDTTEARDLQRKIIYGDDFYMSTIAEKLTRMTADSMRDYVPYLQQIGLKNFMRFVD